MNNNMLIWVAVVAAVFAILWWMGMLTRLSVYLAETREELRKCSWPTWNELIGSTVVVSISIGILGLLTGLVDLVFTFLVRLIT